MAVNLAAQSRIRKAMKALTDKRIMVGIPASGNARDDGPDGNADIAYTNELGSPVKNIPARPFLRPGVKLAMPDATVRLRKAARSALKGDFSIVEDEFENAGQICADSVRTVIQNGLSPALAQSTIERRAAKGQAGAVELLSRQRGNAASKELAMIQTADLAKPLIDTGELIQHITFVVRDQ